MNPFKLTDNQKRFLIKRNIKQGDIHMLPMFGFFAYKKAEFSCGEFVPANPWTLPVSKYPVKVLSTDGNFVELKFVNGPKKILAIPSFFVMIHTIEDRNYLETALVAVFCYVPFVLKNLYLKIKESK